MDPSVRKGLTFISSVTYTKKVSLKHENGYPSDKPYINN